jgi:hypothetical protein
MANLSQTPSSAAIFFLNLIFLTREVQIVLLQLDHPPDDPDLLLDLSALLDLELW